MKRFARLFSAFLLFAVLLCTVFSAVGPNAEASGTVPEVPVPVSYGKSYKIVTSHAAYLKGHADSGSMLTDHLYDTTANYGVINKNWVGFCSDGTGRFSVDVILDLGDVYENVRHINAAFMQLGTASVSFPDTISLSVSRYGEDFARVENAGWDVDPSTVRACGLFRACFETGRSFRYVKLHFEGAKNAKICLCELEVDAVAEGFSRIEAKDQNGRQYTDADGLVYSLNGGQATVVGYVQPAVPSSGAPASAADFNRPGTYTLGAGSENPVTVEAEFMKTTNKNFSHMANDIRSIVIHNTATVEEDTDALRWKNVLLSGRNETSWHYTVDDTGVIRHNLQDQYCGWHAGGNDNYQSIGIELCVNGAPTDRRGNFVFSGAAYDEWVNTRFRKTLENTAVLVAELLVRYGLDESAVIQHNDSSGKNCPQWMRYSSASKSFVHDGDNWKYFLSRVHFYYSRLQKGASPTGGNLVIPQYLLFGNGHCYPVTGIVPDAYWIGNDKPVSVFLPRSIRSVGKEIFGQTAHPFVFRLSENNPFLKLSGGLPIATGYVPSPDPKEPVHTPSEEPKPDPKPEPSEPPAESSAPVSSAPPEPSEEPSADEPPESSADLTPEPSGTESLPSEAPPAESEETPPASASSGEPSPIPSSPASAPAFFGNSSPEKEAPSVPIALFVVFGLVFGGAALLIFVYRVRNRV